MRKTFGLFIAAALTAASSPAGAFWLPWSSRAAAPKSAQPAGLYAVLVPKGTVQIRSGASGEWTPVTGNTQVREGVEIHTKDASTAELKFPDGSRMVLSPQATFSLDKFRAAASAFDLKVGELKAYFAGVFTSRLSVKTPTAVCAVRGTVFDLAAGVQGNSNLAVEEGHVDVTDSQGHEAVLGSEETIKVGAQGNLGEPRLIPLTAPGALPAARPVAVITSMANQQTRTMLEKMRNLELKANEAQIGEDAVDAFGRRVRIEEYWLRPATNEFKLLFLTLRSTRFDWGYYDETFHTTIPDDITQVPSIVAGTFMASSMPSNWLTNLKFYATNTIDADTENVALGDPVAINFSGYFSAGYSGSTIRYYPATVDHTQTLSGPGVPNNSREQFDQKQSWNVSTNMNTSFIGGTSYSNLFTWQQSVPNTSGVLTTMDQFQLDPTNATDVSKGGCQVGGENCGVLTSLYNNTKVTTSYPSGTDKADLLSKTTYPDGSTVSVEKILVNQNGSIFDLSSNPVSSDFNQNGNYNLEEVIGSSFFQGRNIDILLSPKILSQNTQAEQSASAIKAN